MRRVMRKLAFCICENKRADQLCGKHELFSLPRKYDPSTS